MKYKLKSFGLIEAVIGSTIIVLVLAAAVGLSSSANKSARLNSSYSQAQNLAEEVLGYVKESEVSGKCYFDDATRPSGDGYYSIDCFNSANILQSQCRSLLSQFPKPILVGIVKDSNGYIRVNAAVLKNPAFSSYNFGYKVTVKKLDEVSSQTDCGKVGNTVIPLNKCRFVEVDVKWQETSGEKHHKISQLFTDWRR